ncbi:glycodelin-like isoform X3 [Saimiri boliviensis]|uniref:glycodelin-like isoform X3 n=1 Tax=Saimiri boliviensis TaxID=27679 RepID=UPI003D779F9B
MGLRNGMARLWAGLLSALLLHQAPEPTLPRPPSHSRAQSHPQPQSCRASCTPWVWPWSVASRPVTSPRPSRTWRSQRDAPLRIYITSLMPTTEGNLEIILHRWENNSCVEKKVLAEKTENPKNFRINCADMAVNEATLLETDYDKFLFLCLKSTAAPRQSTMCQYLARSLEADAEVLKAFFRAFKTLPVQIWFLLEWYQVPEPCPI